jgi:CRP/FNR family transcriptional regulator, cyclic AMP receptor protein
MTTTKAAGGPLGIDELQLIDAYWRAANYLSVGQIYLRDNPLLREPLTLDHVKPRLLGHWDDATEVASVRARITWTAHQPTRLAWLDGEFASAIAPWPQITSALLARATRRARLLSFRLAITELKHVDLRVLLLLWHLADRWGTVTAEGVHLELDLTHELIARMIGAHRTSVTLALQELSDEGRIARKGRRLTLLGTPPDNLNDTLTALATQRP